MGTAGRLTSPTVVPPHRELARARERGASAVEYGLMLAAITVIIVSAVFAFGTAVQGTFERGECALSPGQTPDTVC